MTIVKIAPEWNNAHASLNDVDYILPGWAEVTEEFKSTWEESGPFVDIEVDEAGKITSMVACEEILPAEPETQETTEEKLAGIEAAIEAIINEDEGEGV